MIKYSEAFVGIDTSKLRNAVAVAEAGRMGEVRFLGEIDTTDQATCQLVAKLASKYASLTFCYEAGPTGYGLHRLIERLGHTCVVVAPSLIPKRKGDHVKTNRRDALELARLLRANELTAVWVPDQQHESMRDLTRARETAMRDLTRKRQQISSFLLRLGLHYPGKTAWGRMHRLWLCRQKIAQREQRIVFEDAVQAEVQAQARLDRLAQAIRDAVPDWSLAPMVTALQALRGIDLIAAATILAEIGDLTRFRSPRELMSYLGLVPSERSTGDRVKRGGITKAGNTRARRILVEAAWSYRFAPRVGVRKQAKVAACPEPVRAIAWQAQMRLAARYKALGKAGKKSTVVATAVARELAGFVWAIDRAMGNTARTTPVTAALQTTEPNHRVTSTEHPPAVLAAVKDKPARARRSARP